MSKEEIANLINLLSEHGSALVAEVERGVFIEGVATCVVALLAAVVSVVLWRWIPGATRDDEPVIDDELVIIMRATSALIAIFSGVLLVHAAPLVFATRAAAIMELLK